MDARVAFAIGRNVGNAVTRNRLRRRLRAAIGEIGAGLEPGAYLFGAGLAAVTLPYEALREHVRGLVGSVRTTR